jgi:hypothetical protein
MQSKNQMKEVSNQKMVEQSVQLSVHEFKDYLQSYIENTFKQFERWRDVEVKILFWIWTVFIVVIGATGFVGNPQNPIQWTNYHVLFFHTVFLIVWLFILDSQLHGFMYKRMAFAAEIFFDRYYLKMESLDLGINHSLTEHLKTLKKDEAKKIPHFSVTQNRYIGSVSWIPGGRGHFQQAAAILIVLLYGGVIVKAKLGREWGTIDWLINGGLVALFFASWFWERWNQKQIVGKIEKDWQFIDKEFGKLLAEADLKDTPTAEQIEKSTEARSLLRGCAAGENLLATLLEDRKKDR